MRVPAKRLASLCFAFLVAAAGSLAAAPPDLRLVDAMADRDTARVRALLGAGLDPDTARADGARRCSGRPTGTTARPSTCCCGPAPTPTPPTTTG